tara:strand:+ start:367 stop:2076 length:1710 start_codon:yes stop_codon:yes gene_type:complete
MKKIKIKFILYIVLFFSTFNLIHAKNLDKYYDANNISDYFSGILSLNDNEYASSYEYLKNLRGLEDSHSYYSQLYQRSLINLDKFYEAYIYSKRLEEKGIDSFESNLIIGVYYLKNKKFENAKRYFQKLKFQKNKGIIEDLISISLNNWISLLSLDKEAGLSLIDQIPPRFENIKKIQNVFMHCYYDSETTNILFNELLSDKSIDFSRYAFFHAKYLHNNGKAKEARESLELNLKLFPTNLLLGQYRLDLKNKKVKNFSDSFNCKNISDNTAELLYIASNALSSQSAYVFSNFYLNLSKFLNENFISFETLHAENFYNLEQYDKAMKIYNKISKKGSVYDWHASKRISLILANQGKDKESLNYLKKKYEKIKSPNVFQIYYYAKFLKNNKQFDESINYYTEVLNLISKDHYLYPKATDGRGVSYERLGKWDEAEKDLLNSLSVSPNQPYVINYLAYSWIEKGINIKKSLEMLKKANELKKNDGYIIDSLGWALFKLKKFKEAKKYLQLAVVLFPSDPIVNDHYADSLWMNNKNIQARYYWKYVLTLDEAEPELKNKIKKKLIFGPKVKL